MTRFTAFIFALFTTAQIAVAVPKAPAAKPVAKPVPSRVTTAERPESPGVTRPFAAADYNPSIEPEVSAEAFVLCDALTGRVLLERNADQPRPVASTQKLLTALIISQDGGLNTNVTAQSEDSRCEETKVGFHDGEVYRRYDLLRLMLVKSMNDVARCLARDNAGSIAAFAEKMNAKAREIGMRRSNFVNPNGLTEPGQYSTGRDMARLALHVYRDRVLRGFMATRSLVWRSGSGKVSPFENTNKLLKYLGLCNGMKTGYTEAAGHCLVSSAAEGGRQVVCVVLGERHREGIWTDSYKLLTYGLAQMKGTAAAN